MASKLWWLLHKDLIVEYRTRQAWPAMLLLGVIVAVVFGMQMELAAPQRAAVAGGFLWLAVLFAGLVTIERTAATEKQNGCWDALILYPISPAIIYLSKLFANLAALLVLECVLIPLFVMLTDVSLFDHVWPILLVAVLTSVGVAAIGTLVSALTHGLRQKGAVLTLLVLPLAFPVVLAAAESTRLIAVHDLGDMWWRWIQFLAGYSIIYTTVGIVLFGFLVEE